MIRSLLASLISLMFLFTLFLFSRFRKYLFGFSPCSSQLARDLTYVPFSNSFLKFTKSMFNSDRWIMSFWEAVPDETLRSKILICFSRCIMALFLLVFLLLEYLIIAPHKVTSKVSQKSEGLIINSNPWDVASINWGL